MFINTVKKVIKNYVSFCKYFNVIRVVILQGITNLQQIT